MKMVLMLNCLMKINNFKFKCLDFDDSEDVLNVYAKFSELNKKQYNYDKDLHKAYDSIQSECVDGGYADECGEDEEFTATGKYYYDDNGNQKACPYLILMNKVELQTKMSMIDF